MLNKNYKTKDRDVDVLISIFERVNATSQVVFYNCKNAQENKNIISGFLQKEQICDIFRFFSCSKGEISKVLNQSLIEESKKSAQVVIVENLQDISYQDYAAYLNFLKIINKQKHQIMILNTYCHNRKSNFGLFLIKNLLESFLMEICHFGSFDYHCDMHSFRVKNQINAVNFENKELMLMGKAHKVIPNLWSVIADSMICLDNYQLSLANENYLLSFYYLYINEFFANLKNYLKIGESFNENEVTYPWVRNLKTRNLKHLSYLILHFNYGSIEKYFDIENLKENILELLEYLEKEESYSNCIALCHEVYNYTKEEFWHDKEFYYLKKCANNAICASHFYLSGFLCMDDNKKIELLSTALKYAEKLNSRSLLSSIYFCLFTFGSKEEKFENAKKCIQEAVYSSYFNDFENSLYECIDCFLEDSLFDKAEAFVKKYQDYFLLINEQKLYYLCYEALGSLYFRKSDFASAIDCYNKAINYYRKYGQRKDIASVYDCIAGKFSEIDDYEKTIYYYKLAIKYNVFAPELKMCYIADCYQKLHNDKMAIKYLEKSFKIDIDGGNVNYVCDLVDLYVKHNQLSKASKWIEIFNKTKCHYKDNYQCFINESQGDIFAIKNHIDQAVKFYKKALNFFKKRKREFQIVRLTSKIANLYYSFNDYKTAIKWDKKNSYFQLEVYGFQNKYLLRHIECFSRLQKYQECSNFFISYIKKSDLRVEDFQGYMKSLEMCLDAFRKQKKYYLAQNLLSENYKLESSSSDNYRLLLVCLVIINHYQEINQMEKAQEFFLKQVEIFAKKDDWVALHRLYLGFGVVILESEDCQREINFNQYKYLWQYAIYLLEQGLFIGKRSKEENISDRISFLMILGESKQKYLKGENGLKEYQECVEISQREEEYNYFVNCKVRIVEIRNNTNPDYQKNIEDLYNLLELKDKLDIVNYYELTAFLADSYYKLGRKEEARPYIEALFRTKHYSKFFDENEIKLYKEEYGF